MSTNYYQQNFQMVEEETQKRIELLIKKRVDSILESKKHEIEEEIRQRVSFNI